MNRWLSTKGFIQSSTVVNSPKKSWENFLLKSNGVSLWQNFSSKEFLEFLFTLRSIFVFRGKFYEAFLACRWQLLTERLYFIYSLWNCKHHNLLIIVSGSKFKRWPLASFSVNLRTMRPSIPAKLVITLKRSFLLLRARANWAEDYETHCVWWSIITKIDCSLLR